MSNKRDEKWLFIFADNVHCLITAENLKSAVTQLIKEYGMSNSNLFLKSLSAMNSNEEIIDLYNHFQISYYKIAEAYLIQEIIYKPYTDE